jgi:plasmid stabilization system protein ParE
MTTRLAFSELARDDIRRQYQYLLDESSHAIAGRFTAALKATVQQLKDRPYLGSPRLAQRLTFHPKFLCESLRVWPVTGFESILIIYRVLSDRVLIDRIVHARQDLERIFEG